ncbi:hypothetical protein NMY22_g15798 [Coprinellus aureogranulatus]|nr:hypothetical protein NMY22_g15798 [Coprinellus aureogranulatus]
MRGGPVTQNDLEIATIHQYDESTVLGNGKSYREGETTSRDLVVNITKKTAQEHAPSDLRLDTQITNRTRDEPASSAQSDRGRRSPITPYSSASTNRRQKPRAKAYRKNGKLEETRRGTITTITNRTDPSGLRSFDPRLEHHRGEGVPCLPVLHCIEHKSFWDEMVDKALIPNYIPFDPQASLPNPREQEELSILVATEEEMAKLPHLKRGKLQDAYGVLLVTPDSHKPTTLNEAVEALGDPNVKREALPGPPTRLRTAQGDT